MGVDVLEAVTRWHRVVAGDLEVGEVLADDCIFFSPVVFRPISGKAMTETYLRAAGQVFAAAGAMPPSAQWQPFAYRSEVVSGRQAALEFEITLDGTYANGIDLITFDDEGLIEEFKVMMRPLKAITLMAEMMGLELARE